MRKRLELVAACAALALIAGAAGSASASASKYGTHRLSRAKLAAHGWTKKVAPAHVKADSLTHALRSDRITENRYVLERARSLFHLGAVRSRFGSVAKPDPRDASMLLRDVFARYSSMSAAERGEADILLARPTQGSADPGGQGYQDGVQVAAACTTNFCFHWVTTTDDAVTNGDANSNGIPDFVDATAGVWEHVHDVEVTQLQFKAPKSDQTSADNGGNGKTDVYIADVGDDDLYGYCTSDDPNIERLGTSQYSFYDVSAYCVVDNDYSTTQFPPPSANGLAAMQVTAAHEHFHAVQFAYDALEDNWLMEGSAVWMEDVVYDEINDYYQYLPVSQMGLPHIPLDYSTPSSDNSVEGQSKYGAFLFFRFLSDVVLASDTGAPDVQYMSRIWLRADSTRGASSDEYSLQAVKGVLAERTQDFTSVYALFGVANLFPADFYEEGSFYDDFAFPPYTRVRPTAAKRTKILKGGLDHLTEAYGVFSPGKGVKANQHLRLTIDGPLPGRGGAAHVVIVFADGSGTYDRINLNEAGDATIKTVFGKGKVSNVVVVLSNGSTAFTCFQNRPFSCEGSPTYDDQLFKLTGTLVR